MPEPLTQNFYATKHGLNLILIPKEYQIIVIFKLLKFGIIES